MFRVVEKITAQNPLVPSAIFVGLSAAVWSCVVVGDLDRLSLLLLAFYSISLLGQERHGTAHSKPVGFALLLLLGVLVFGLVQPFDKLTLAAAALILWFAANFVTSMTRSENTVAGLVLILAVPLPSDWAATLAATLAHLQAFLVEGVLEIFGYAVERVGSQVMIEEFRVAINRDCSGISLLAPVLMGTLVAIALRPLQPFRVLFILIVALGSALLLNSVRVVTASWLATFDNQVLFDGFHDGAGALLMMVGWLLPVLIWAPGSNLLPGSRSVKLLACLVCVIVVVTWFMDSSARDARSTANTDLLPTYHAGWIGEPVAIKPEEVRILGARAVSRKRYSHGTEAGDRLVTVMKFSSLKKAQEHSAEYCFRALGWTVFPQAETNLEDGTKITASRVQGLSGRQMVFEALQTRLGTTTRLQVVQSHQADQAFFRWMTEILQLSGTERTAS